MKQKNTKTPKLTLGKTTIYRLTENQLQVVAGGQNIYSDSLACPSGKPRCDELTNATIFTFPITEP
jgi:hypothetical protein